MYNSLKFMDFVCVSRAEQTNEYSPPEALLNASWHQGPISKNVKYVAYV